MGHWYPLAIRLPLTMLWIAGCLSIGHLLGGLIATLWCKRADEKDVLRCARAFIAAATPDEIERAYAGLRYNVRWLDGERDFEKLRAPQTIKREERTWN